MRLERRAEELKKGAREGTGVRRNKRARITGATTAVSQPGSDGGRSGAAAGSPHRRDDAGISRTFRRRAMYENLMEAAVTDENCKLALQAVKRNKGAAGIDRMTKGE